MVKNKLGTGSVLNKLHNQEHVFKKELSKTFLEYLDSLPSHKRIEQIHLLLHDRYLPTSDRGLTLQEKRCLYLASQGKEIKEVVITNQNDKLINFLTSRAPMCDHNKN